MGKRTDLCIVVLPVIVNYDLSGEVPKQDASTAAILLARVPRASPFCNYVTFVGDRGSAIRVTAGHLWRRSTTPVPTERSRVLARIADHGPTNRAAVLFAPFLRVTIVLHMLV